MLDIKEMQKLFEILNRKDDTLQEIEGAFLTVFNESLSVFRASYSLANLINLNLLTAQQRIIAIFLLIENFKSEGIKKHPFGSTIFNISHRTTEPFERKMIADIFAGNLRDKYSKAKIESLYEQEQAMIPLMEESIEIKKAREEFIAGLPKISQSKKSEVHNVVSDFNEKDKKFYPPQFEVSHSSIKQQELSYQSFNIGFLRPIPSFLEITPSQFNWLSPGIISDVHWDNTAQVQKRLVKCKQLMKRAMQHHLTKDECTQIDRALDSQPYAVLNMQIGSDQINALVKANPFIAISFLVKLSNYPIISQYLQSILESPVSLNSLDVISRLTKASRIPSEFLITYTIKSMKECEAIPEQHKDRAKIARVLANFIKSLTKNKLLDLSAYPQDVDDFVGCFIEVQECQGLKKIMSKQG